MAIKVLVIDDSPLIRGLLTEILNAAPDIKVVGTAEDPFDAREKIKQLNPDVLSLDVEMPRMDGISFLKNLMRLRPMPVVMVSTLTAEGAPATLQALELGAIDYVSKPKNNVAEALTEYQDELHNKIRTAALAKVRASTELQASVAKGSILNAERMVFKPQHILAIGASTGGTEAIKEVVLQLPAHCPPTVVTQHIPPMFSTSFAARLNAAAKVTVYEATSGQKLEPGNVYIAPGDDHLTIRRTAQGYICQLDHDAPVNRHRPAVDKLFDSVAEVTKGKATGIILTGMGADGAKGLLNMRNAGCHTIAQDEASSVVWGMPGAAVELGAAETILPLYKIAKQALISATK
ncbi:chemotaxis response regulator protein-glutamate methylesterase [Saccharobesus litoralis]|uniref:Protein-glutamate methylesterase/protein-glutamine glutaminase n=1 Tax=Saccharobesus litoralis TaxID=2172099 RepID=A0A2S0VWM1_9ALTE|nr:chemotaxis response regulator protein-glutamate methylesterase [Saccharobesus litoralis]AWB68617.1 chemotaxis response regulator protein-glutamate methylesterase [Saccharobesus litoralis]